MRDVETLREEVKKYIDHADDHVLKMIHAMLKADSEADWWNDLDEDERASIERGIDDISKGRTVSHEEVVKQYSEWLSK